MFFVDLLKKLSFLGLSWWFISNSYEVWKSFRDEEKKLILNLFQKEISKKFKCSELDHIIRIKEIKKKQSELDDIFEIQITQ